MLNVFRKHKLLLYIILTIIAIYCIGLIPWFFDDKTLIFGYDMRNQYYPFYHEFESLITQSIENKTLPFWSWNLLFGNDFFFK